MTGGFAVLQFCSGLQEFLPASSLFRGRRSIYQHDQCDRDEDFGVLTSGADDSNYVCVSVCLSVALKLEDTCLICQPGDCVDSVLKREAEAEGSEMCRVKVFREQILLGLSSMNLSLTNSSGGCWHSLSE